MTEWTAKLPTIDPADLGELDLDTLLQPWDGRLETDIGDSRSDVTPDAGYRSPPLKRRVADLRAVNEHALTHLVELPGPGEAYHFLLGDRLGLWDIVPALLRRIEPVTVRQLHISTLSFGSKTAAELMALVDAGKIDRVVLLVSVMFSSMNKRLYDELIPPLLARGHRAAAMRTHAKILAFELTDGHRFVVESSSNLRSCHCAEQTTVINDAGLYRFHVEWMDRAVASCQTGAAAGITKGVTRHG